MKISELAKKLKIPPKVLLIQIIKLGIPAKSAQGVLSEEAVDKVVKVVAKNKPSIDVEEIKKEAAPKKKPAKAAAKPKTEKPSKKQKKVAQVKPKQEQKAEEKPVAVIKEERPPLPKKEVTKKEAAPLRPEGKPTPAVIVEAQPEQKAEEIPPEKMLQIKFPVTVKDLSEKLSVGAGMIIKMLMDRKIFATINQLVDEKDAQAIALKLGYMLNRLPTMEEEEVAIHQEKERKEDLRPRPPVVTFMGHVDHGKTSLLDYIRKSKVAAQEKGGITQHIGAYEVSLDKGKITFLDTPGHEAFTAMRARGANATDLVVLVVAADDGIMPQTIEALDHARAAGVPIIVAINKIDKPNIELDRVKKQLAEAALLSEDWGGKTVTVNVSAKTGQGIDELLEMILLEAEMLELKANPNKPARGVIIDAKLSKGGGPIATILVQNGTLRQGDIVVAGCYYGKIRALIDDKIHRAKEAPPSMPVEILGLNGVPQAGDTFMVISDEKKAVQICDIRVQKLKDQQAVPTARRITLEDLYSEIQKGKIKELKVILKADVSGSLEAISDSLAKIESKNITLTIIHKAIGDINESDILLAAASNAIVIGFHVRKTPEADTAAKKEHVDTRLYGIIYEAIADIKAAMEGMLEPHLKEVFLGKVLIKQVFKLSKAGIVAGSIVQKGKVTRNAECRVIRNGQPIHKGRISSLKRFKDDVREVPEGYECGITVGNFNDLKAGDVIDCFGVEKIARKL